VERLVNRRLKPHGQKLGFWFSHHENFCSVDASVAQPMYNVQHPKRKTPEFFNPGAINKENQMNKLATAITSEIIL
jgi:hypothetical protein